MSNNRLEVIMNGKKRSSRKRLPALLLCILYVSTILISMTGYGKEASTASTKPAEGSAEEGSQAQETESSVAAMGRYMETAFALPEGRIRKEGP